MSNDPSTPAPVDASSSEEPPKPEKKKKKRKRPKKLRGYAAARARASGRRPLATGGDSSARTWTKAHVVGALVVGALVGAFATYGVQSRARTTEPSAASDTSAQPAAASAVPAAVETDSFGRGPSDPHFGHDHPPNQGAAAPPATGEPDSFGRQPGTEHYGHKHP